MAKKKVVTTEEIDIEAAAIPEENPLPVAEPSILTAQAEMELAEFFESLQGSASVIKIYKMANGKQQYCGSAEPSAVNEDFILKQWGGGTYYLRAVMNGKYIPNGYKSFTIYEPPGGYPKPADNAADNAAGSTNPYLGEINILRESLNRQHEMILQMLQANSKNDNRSDLAELIQAFGLLQQQAPKAPDLTTLLPGMMDLFKTTMEMAKDAAGAGDGKTDWGAVVLKGLNSLPAVLQTMVPAARAAAGQNPPGGEDMNAIMAAQLRAGMEWLKRKGKAGKDPGFVAEMIYENMDDYQEIAVAILNTPIENILAMDTELQREPLRTWFLHVYKELKGIIDENQRDNIESDTGQAGKPAELAGNETPDN